MRVVIDLSEDDLEHFRAAMRRAKAAAQDLTPEQITAAASFVASLSGKPADPANAEAGRVVFAENCAACHGDDGKGNQELGAPNLTDAIALYASDEAAIAQQIRQPRQGVMPAWLGRLGDTKVKELAVYVHSLGGGQ